MRDIVYLLNKYSTKQPGEKWSNESDIKWQNIKIMKHKILLLDTINSSYFRLRGGQKERVIYLMKRLNFNKVCPRCSDEQVIVLICFYVKCEYIPNYERRRCKKAFDDYNISSNLVDKFMVYLARLGVERALFSEQ